MSLTIEKIRTTENSEALFDLLSAELQRLLPPKKQDDREWYYETIESLPRGLRAMAGMYFFDKSITLDSLAWHFGNQNDERDLRETLNGLRETGNARNCRNVRTDVGIHETTYDRSADRRPRGQRLY